MRAGGKEALPVEERFWRMVARTDGCWLWTGSTTVAGYPRLSIGSRTTHTRGQVFAHRFSYELHRGPIPVGLTLDHLCRQPRCVRPEHLEAVSLHENVLRGTGLGAANARKTYCKRGHLLDDANNLPYAKRQGIRACRICHTERSRLSMARQRAKR